MVNKKLYKKDEYMTWRELQIQQLNNFKVVKCNLIFNVSMYFLIFIIEYYLAIKSNAEVLKADAFNNLSGVISTFLLIIGIHIASDQDETRLVGFPVSNQHYLDNQKRVRLSRYRFETIFTLVAAILMIEIAINIVINGIHNFLYFNKQVIPNPIGILGAVISIIIIAIIYIINFYSGKKTNNAALLASAQDSLGDILASLGTAISIFIMWQFKLRWIDSVVSIIIGVFILFSGFKIFIKSSLNLVDYFNPKKEQQYQKIILNNHEIKAVPSIEAHYNGNLIIITAEVVVNEQMTIRDSFILAERIEKQLYDKCNVSDTKIIFYPEKL